MYAGFITTKRVVKRLGIHQKLDMAAYRMISPYLARTKFPTLKQVLHFEGLNGPDGIKVKSLGVHDPSHMYDPVTGTGVLPELIEGHYQRLVSCLQEGDDIRASFEAAWLAHFVTDGLTPAHHFPYDEKKDELFGEDSDVSFLRKHWHWLGGKGVFSTHLNFEMGVASTLLIFPIKAEFSEAKLAEARQLGALPFFKQEAREVADLGLYDRFYKEGWTAELARIVREQIAPHASQVVGLLWLLAYLEAGQLEVVADKHNKVKLVKK
jgi:hypothetical protein